MPANQRPPRRCARPGSASFRHARGMRSGNCPDGPGVPRQRRRKARRPFDPRCQASLTTATICRRDTRSRRRKSESKGANRHAKAQRDHLSNSPGGRRWMREEGFRWVSRHLRLMQPRAVAVVYGRRPVGKAEGLVRDRARSVRQDHAAAVGSRDDRQPGRIGDRCSG